jgi:hypothetical protein
VAPVYADRKQESYPLTQPHLSQFTQASQSEAKPYLSRKAEMQTSTIVDEKRGVSVFLAPGSHSG